MSRRNGRAARRAAMMALMALVIPAVVLGAAGDRDAARADDSVGRPADGMFTVQGHGWGHGRGMSQYGAYGAATQGLTAQQILDFYYPGTGTGTTALGQIKVVLTDDNTDVDVFFDPNMAVTDVATGDGMVLPSGYDRWRVVRSGAGLALQGLQNGAWVPYNLPHTAAPYAGPLKFWDGDGQPVKVNLPSGTNSYRGSIMGVTSGTGLRTVNELSTDDYVRGVVARESPASWPAAALQAQAVAARSYAVYLAQHKSSTFWDICDTTACQVYGGVNAETSTTESATAATAMQVRTYGGQAIFAEFSSSNGGYTVAGSMPYFVAKPDPYDGVSNSAAHSWSVLLSAATIEGKYPSIGKVQAITILGRDGRGEWGGRVTGNVRFSGTDGNVTVTGDQVRQAFGLKSNWFLFIGGGPAIQARYNGDPDLQTVLGSPVGAEQYSNGVAWQVYQNGRLYWSASTGVHLIRGGLLEEFLDAGGPSVFGAPTSDEAYSGAGAYNTFANDVVFIWSPASGAHYVRGAIRLRWGQLGSEWGGLGYPTSDEVYTAGGVYSTFTGGRIYWSPSTGAWEVTGPIGTEWLTRGGPSSGSGFPASGPLAASGGGSYQRFAAGWWMYWSSATDAHVVRGGIQEKWRQTNAEWGPLGYPDGDEAPVAGGRGVGQSFAKGSVLWSPSSGAHTMVDGPLTTAWDALGGASSAANLPTTDQAATGARGGGRWQNFLGDYSMFWSQDSGAHVLRGAIRAYWRNAGAEWSTLGYPTSDETAVAGGVRQQFQGGTLQWSAATGAVSLVP